MLRRILREARSRAGRHLPQGLVDAGRHLGEVAQRTLPPSVLELGRKVERLLDDGMARGATMSAAPASGIERDIARARDLMREEEAALIVVYATDAQIQDVTAIRSVFGKMGEAVRFVDLAVDPRAFRNISGFTNVMVPPYVFIDGRHWGGRYEIEALEAEGDLPAIIAGRLEELSPVARAIGKVHESFSDAVTIANMQDRFARGHSLCIDGIDTWMERDGGTGVLFHQGQRIPEGELDTVLAAIERDVADGGLEAIWRLEPAVKLD